MTTQIVVICSYHKITNYMAYKQHTAPCSTVILQMDPQSWQIQTSKYNIWKVFISILQIKQCSGKLYQEMLLVVEIFIKYCKIPLTSNIQRLDRCQIVSYSGLWDSTYTNLKFLLLLYFRFTSDQRNSPSGYGSGSSGSSSALYGVFIAKKLDGAADKNSGDTKTVNVQTDYQDFQTVRFKRILLQYNQSKVSF